MGGAEVKEECVEPEDGAGNTSGGNTPMPHNAGISTRRTTYTVVSVREEVTSSVFFQSHPQTWQHLHSMFHFIHYFTGTITCGSRKALIISKPDHPSCPP